MRKFSLVTVLFLSSLSMFAQMQINGENHYGNEWIDYSKDYLRIEVRSEGVYKVEYQDLIAQGFPAQFQGSQLKLFMGGEEQAILTTNESSWTGSDYFLFYGDSNDGSLDRFHFEDWENEQLNPEYSMYANERVYFLTLSDVGQQNKRYIERANDLSNNTKSPEPFYMHKDMKVFSEFNWSPVAPDVPDIQNSSFIVTEGFGSRMMSSHEMSFNLSAIYEDGANPSLEIRSGSNIQPEHEIHISVNDQLIMIDTFRNLTLKNYNLEFDKSLLGGQVTVSYEGKGVSDNSTIAYAALNYPREFDAEGARYFDFDLKSNTEEKYYEIRRYSAGGQNFIFDIANGMYLRPTTQSGTAKFLYDTEGLEDTKLVLVAAQLGLKKPTFNGLKRYQNLNDLNPQYLILTSEKLNNSEGGSNPVEDYAAFRSSERGGSYTSAIINVEELYDQYAFGVKNHSLAIRNFGQHIKPLWPDFQMVFIIGKALSYGNKNKNTPIESLVPTYGRPGSDVLLFAEEGFIYPYVGVGRLAARNKEDVRNYLDKMERHADLFDVSEASIEDRQWLKQIIHLSGGDPGIQQDIFNHLSLMENIIEGVSYGGNVNTFRKISSDPIQTSVSEDIINRINQGISMLTFFGHSSAGTFDFSVEDPSQYENEGKLPLIFSMGCRSGDIHETVFSLSENMILTKDKGAIAFIASSGSAFPTPLAAMGEEFYAQLSRDYYGEPVGLALKKVLEKLNNPSFTKVRTLLEQNTLHGDPAFTLYKAEGPDYIVDLASVNTNGDVGATDENISLNFEIVNLGMGVKDSINNWIIHEYANGTKDTIAFRTPAPSNRDLVELALPNPGFEAMGKNIIEIVLDVDNKIEEFPSPIGEENNSLKLAYSTEGFVFYIFDDSAFPVYPPNFGIVNDPATKLYASSTNALGQENRYMIQLDTTELFNSPLMEEAQIVSYPAVIEWKPQLSFQNNTVYYWRVAPVVSDSVIWNTSSFIYLENSSQGWNQSHLYQWQKDDFRNMYFDDDKRDFLYAQNLSEVIIKNGAFPQHTPSVSVQNNPIDYLSSLGDGEIPSGLYITVLDGTTGLPWLNQPSPDGGLYDSELYTWWAENYPVFPFRTDTPENRAKAITFLDDIVPDDAYVSVFTIQRRDYPGIGNYKADEWAGDASSHPEGKDLLSVLESYGAQRVRELTAGPKPYILAFRKNDSSYEVKELVAENIDASIELKVQVLGSWFEGSMKSTKIGPAVGWNKLLWNLDDYNTQEDDITINLYGLVDGASDSLLFADIQSYELDITSIDAEEFPYLRLEMISVDQTSKTSAQMPYWRVLYEVKPEVVIDAPKELSFQKDTLFLGEDMSFSSFASNISGSDLDSLLVRYTVVDPLNIEHTTFKRTPPIKAGSSVELNFSYTNKNNLGDNIFIVELNPNMDQAEQYVFNNTGVINYNVQGDRINPLLDVTFDGKRINNGDVVSSRPHIRIELRDNNNYFPIADISQFELSMLKEPDNRPEAIDLQGNDILFTPADSTGINLAVIDYFPELEQGEYVLYVQAEDMSGNESGDQELEIRFRVEGQAEITDVINYPNPFSTSTQFLFTLTGEEIPDDFLIQIVSMSGVVVREIGLDEIGELRMGVNRPNLRWRGTDSAGALLPNGVYVYRLLGSFDENADPDNSSLQLDKFSRLGFGKLVIMR